MKTAARGGGFADVFTASGAGAYTLTHIGQLQRMARRRRRRGARRRRLGRLTLTSSPPRTCRRRTASSRTGSACLSEDRRGLALRSTARARRQKRPSAERGSEVLSSEGLADSNADGRVDIFGHVGDLLPGHGDGRFGPPEAFVVYSVTDFQIVDFNGDGLLDVVYPGSAGAVEVLVNQRQSVNTPPTVDAGEDRTFYTYDSQFDDYPIILWASASDADLHRLSYQWHDADGNPLVAYPTGDTSRASVELPTLNPGSYEFTVTVTDGRGGVSRDSVIVTILPLKEMVLHVGQDYVDTRGNWEVVNDASAASGVRIHDRNAGAAKVTSPFSNPPTDRRTSALSPTPRRPTSCGSV